MMTDKEYEQLENQAKEFLRVCSEIKVRLKDCEILRGGIPLHN